MRRAFSLLAACAAVTWASAQQYEEVPFGRLPDTKDKDGKTVRGSAVTAYTLVNKTGMKAKIINYGGILTELHVPDKTGKVADVVAGFDNLEGYMKGHPYFGSNVGRCANRIANAKFSIDGKEYTIPGGNPHSLHGGKIGFDKKMWKAEPSLAAAGPCLKLTYTSKDGEEGYPGNLNVAVTYTLTNQNELLVQYSAETDKPTVCNLAHHSYFNLAGHQAGSILNHELQIAAKNYTPGDATMIPTGVIAPVAGTPFDFTNSQGIGTRIKQIDAKPQGYDLNYALDGTGEKKLGYHKAAKVKEPTSGRVMEVWTDEPGVQFYTGNFLDGTVKGKGDTVYQQYAAFCLECQKFPDAVNKVGKPGWASPILRPGERYNQTTVYSFTNEK